MQIGHKKSIIIAALAVAATAAQAVTTYNWTGLGDGTDWSDNANWDTTPDFSVANIMFVTNGILTGPSLLHNDLDVNGSGGATLDRVRVQLDPDVGPLIIDGNPLSITCSGVDDLWFGNQNNTVSVSNDIHITDGEMVVRLGGSTWVELAGNITTDNGNRNIRVRNGGRLILSGTNNVFGVDSDFNIEGGLIEANNSSVFGIGKVRLLAGSSTASGISKDYASLILENGVAISNRVSSVSVANGKENRIRTEDADDAILAGGLVLTTNVWLRPNDGSSLTVASEISGSGAIIHTANGDSIFTASNSYSGGTFIYQGDIKAATNFAMGTGSITLDGNSNQTIRAEFSLGGCTITNDLVSSDANADGGNNRINAETLLGNGLLTGQITLETNLEVYVGAATTLTIDGNITGSGGMTKAFDGNLVLNADNDFAGAVDVFDGDLIINGDMSAATGDILIGAGASLHATIGGSGTVGGNTTINDKGYCAPGHGGAGTLAFAGDLDIGLAGETNKTGNLAFQLGTTSDKVVVQGTLDIGSELGADDLDISDIGGLGNGQYILIQSSNLVGTLDGADTSVTNIAGSAATGTLAVDGNNLVLNVTGLGGYSSWAGGWGEDLSDPYGDFDEDGLLNIYEYGLNGDPTNNTNTGTSPTFGIQNVGGTNYFGYIHPQLHAEGTGLDYSLALATDLAGPWTTNSGYVVLGTNVTVGPLDFVTNVTTTVESKKFIRLIIEETP